MNEPRLLGVLVTFRRPADLERTLEMLAHQERILDRLVVVDNDAAEAVEAIVASASGAAKAVEYLPMAENAGFPGGLAAGISALLDGADDRDWVVVLDDDDPPYAGEAFSELLRFAEQMIARDPRTAAVGIRGARFDARRAVLTRIPTRELDVAVPVDCIAGNALPLYRAQAIRRAGSFLPELFFSHEELELGLRLQRGGYTLYAHGELWRQRRKSKARPDDIPERRWRLYPPNWRSYYSLRNTIFILRSLGRSGTALRITIGRGLLKPLVNVPFGPRAALRAIGLNARACADAWRGRLGRTVEPNVLLERPNRVVAAAPSNGA